MVASHQKLGIILENKVRFWDYLPPPCFVYWQNTIISLEYVEVWPKILLILYPSLWNSTTHITIIKIKGCAKSDRARLIQSSFPSLSLMLKAKCARAEIRKGSKTSEVNYFFCLFLKNENLAPWLLIYNLSILAIFIFGNLAIFDFDNDQVWPFSILSI